MIQFKVWNIKEQLMYVDSIYVAASGNAYELTSKKFIETPKEDIIVLRWSGMQDSKSTPIFVGDIIEVIDDKGETITAVCREGIARRQIMENLVDIPCFYFLRKDGKKTFPIVNNWSGRHDLESFKVIGNEYEYPEFEEYKTWN